MIIHISAIGWSFFINFPINDRELLIQRWQTQIFEHCQVNPQTRGIIRFQNDIYMQLAPHILRDNNNIRLSLRFFSPSTWLAENKKITACSKETRRMSGRCKR